jgi:allophanate hydrolase
LSAAERVAEAYRRIAAADRPEVWIHLRDEDDALADARVVDGRVAAGETLALAGATLAVKDNIDVGGLPTTAGCPAFSYVPADDAVAVARLRAAGAIVLGKTNMDQFATGLVGTRSPYGAVRDARRPDYVSGGSSSGSAVAVALGLADLALATDTAGSGRVPAAFQGVVGIKPTRGLVPTRGVVPACRSFDCVSVFAPGVLEGERAVAAMSGPDALDPTSRGWPADAPLAAPPVPRVAVPSTDQLRGALTAAAVGAFRVAFGRLEAAGVELVPIDLAPFLEVARLLYGGAFVAERYAAVGDFVAANADRVDPVVAAIILAGGLIPAHCLTRDRAQLAELTLATDAALAGADALLVPTTLRQPTIAEVAAEPSGVNDRLGTFTNFCNLLDMSAVALPAGKADGGEFGVTLLAPAFHDRVLEGIALSLSPAASAPAPASAQPADGQPAIELFVVGAHLRGQPLNRQLTDRGARLERAGRTAACYRLYRLATTPAKPGLVRVEGGGASIAGELWSLPPAGLASFLAALPAPMALGRVRLDDGSEPIGFLCEPAALQGALDITSYGGWLPYLAATAPVAAIA